MHNPADPPEPPAPALPHHPRLLPHRIRHAPQSALHARPWVRLHPRRARRAAPARLRARHRVVRRRREHPPRAHLPRVRARAPRAPQRPLTHRLGAPPARGDLAACAGEDGACARPGRPHRRWIRVGGVYKPGRQGLAVRLRVSQLSQPI